MITDLIELNDFIVLIETTDSKEAEVSKCKFDNMIIGISFYGSGEVEMEVSFGNEKKLMHNQKGMAFSFAGNETVRFSHKISEAEPLRSVSVFSTIEKIYKLPPQEKELYTAHLGNLLIPDASFKEGPVVKMTPEMQLAIAKIFSTTYENTARLLFLKSQVTELLSHYFAQIISPDAPSIHPEDVRKIQLAKDIISQNLEKPPSLSELSKLIGLNHNKLKKNFKKLFGVPVFKYLQHERLQKAYQLLTQREMTVQEVAWFVGYESVSSFSNAFLKKYGFRPSVVGK